MFVKNVKDNNTNCLEKRKKPCKTKSEVFFQEKRFISVPTKTRNVK
jgi:hypothetical protein